jgi:hypothetical protein
MENEKNKLSLCWVESESGAELGNQGLSLAIILSEKHLYQIVHNYTQSGIILSLDPNHPATHPATHPPHRLSLQFGLLVSLGPAPAQAQPLGQAKVAIISVISFLSLMSINLIKGGISGKIFQKKSYRRYKVRPPKKMSAKSDRAHGLFLIKGGISGQLDEIKS